MEKLFQQRLNRRQLLQGSAAALAVAALPTTPEFPPQPNARRSSKIASRERVYKASQTEQGEADQGTWGYFQTTITEENKNLYGNGTYFKPRDFVYLLRHYADSNEQDQSNYQFEIALCVGKDNTLNSATDSRMPDNWFTQENGAVTFRGKDFIRLVANPIRDIVAMYKQAGMTEIPKQIVYARLIEANDAESNSKLPQECGQPQKGENLYFAVNSSRVFYTDEQSTIEAKRQSDFMRLIAPAHELGHLMFFSQGLKPRGVEAIVGALGHMVMHDEEIKKNHWLTPQEDDPFKYREDQYAVWFYEHSNLVLGDLYGFVNAGYEHYPLHLMLNKIAGYSFKNFVGKLMSLPDTCNPNGRAEDYLKATYPEISFPDIYARYLAEAFKPADDPEFPFFRAIREKLGLYISHYSPGDEVVLYPQQYKYCHISDSTWSGTKVPYMDSTTANAAVYEGQLDTQGRTEAHRIPTMLDVSVGSRDVSVAVFNRSLFDSGVVVKTVDIGNMTPRAFLSTLNK